jgi:magnesium transporter
MDDKATRAARTLVRRFVDEYPDEAARQLESASAVEAVRILGTARPDRSAAVLEQMTPDSAAKVIETADESQVRHLATGIDPAILASLLSRIDEETRNTILDAFGKAQAAELRALMMYPPDTAGSLMDPQVMTFHPETSVEEALRKLRQVGRGRIYDVFVVGPDSGLAGSVPLQDIAVSPPDTKLADLVRPSPSVMAMESREQITETLEAHKVTTLAVVNLDNRLLGVIRHETLLEAAQAEATLDIQTMVGVSRRERALSKVSFAVRKRLPWLNINLATAFLAAGVVGMFEDTIAQFTALAVLLPVVAGQSGNTGSQALAVTMRGLALREIRTGQWLRVATKEVMVALFNSVVIAAVTAAAVYVWSGSGGLALVIGSSMIVSMVAAGLAGAVIPMLLTWLGQDPAQSSSIILTTVTDVAGFLSFLGIARLLSPMLV